MRQSVPFLDHYLTVGGDDFEIKSLDITESDESSGEASGEVLSAVHQLKEYVAGQRRIFDLKLNPQGTDFQKKVWLAMRKIPYGETKSYGDLARTIGSPKAFRAVGGACHRNPIAIIQPCHRVVGSDGKLTGFFGGLDLKKQLLDFEKK